ncbi:MAG: tetratricopeptide repeat protein [Verrucomicrobia bacterium]|nr:tetratricopeptide repeat protein [Verrucomicrobiota bacterium]MDA1086983.1 tetratricopeptide repeat protein [Verrucomicrobiota bacterium]
MRVQPDTRCAALGALWLTVLCCTGAIVAVAGPDPAEELLIRAEAMVEAADGDMAEDRVELAGRGYGLAQRLFRQIADEHPNWHSRHVRSRLAYCAKRIEKVVSKLLKEPAPRSAAGTATDTPNVIEELGEAEDEMAEVDDEELLSREIESTRSDITALHREFEDTAEPVPQTGGGDGAETGPETTDKKPSRLSRISHPFRSLFSQGKDDDDGSGGGPPGAPEATRTSGADVDDRPDSKPDPTAEPDAHMARAQPDSITDPSMPQTSGAVDAMTPVPAANVEDPSAPVVETDLLRVLLRAGEADKVKTLLIEALSRAPDHKDWRLLLGIAYCQGGEYDKAMQVMKVLLREDRTNARAHIILGTAYLAQGNIVVAKDQMQLAVDLDPKLGEAHYNLAQIWVSVEPPDIPSARIHYERAISLGEGRDSSLEKLLR